MERYSLVGANYWTPGQFVRAIDSGNEATEFLAKMVLETRPKNFRGLVGRCLRETELLEEELKIREAFEEEASTWTAQQFAKNMSNVPDQPTQFMYLHYLSKMPEYFREEVREYLDNPDPLGERNMTS